jgi:exonuclease SbcD
MKIGHIADVHLGYKQYNLWERYYDFCHAWMDAIDIIIRNKCEVCLIAGDLFHSRQISPETLSWAISGLDKLQRHGIITFAIEGNHEISRRSDETGWIRFLEEQGHLIIPVDSSFYYNGYNFYGFGWSGNSLNQALDKFEPYTNGNNILMLHADINEIQPNLLRRLAYLFDYVAMGHLHEPKVYSKKFYYPGSLETNSITEIPWTMRGVIISEFGGQATKIHYHTNKRREFRVVKDKILLFNDKNEIIHEIDTSDKVEQEPIKSATIEDIIKELTDIDPNYILNIKESLLEGVSIVDEL